VGRKEGGCAGRMLLYTVAFFSSTRGHALGEGRREKGRASGRERVRLVTNFSEYMCQSPDSARYPKRERESARARGRQGGIVQRQSPDSARYPKERNLALSFFPGYNRIG
jgi:hypothetical protein